jgi:hypothetical protein
MLACCVQALAAEKEAIAHEKEMEVARLRAMQEKQADHQSEQDELRARRYQVSWAGWLPACWCVASEASFFVWQVWWLTCSMTHSIQSGIRLSQVVRKDCMIAPCFTLTIAVTGNFIQKSKAAALHPLCSEP